MLKMLMLILIMLCFTSKDTKVFVPAANLSGKDNQKLSKFLDKGFERSVSWNKYKTNSENKTQQMNVDIFSNQTL